MNSIVSLSGGMDSATVLSYAMAQSNVVGAIGFTYGSKHNFYENAAAVDVCEKAGLAYELIDLSNVATHLQSNLLKSGGDIPEGHYEEKSMEATVVPGRNIIFASILAGIAWTRGASEVYLGIHSGDHAIYADCRKNFLRSMGRAMMDGTDGRVGLRAPFIDLDKAKILQEGFRLGTPYHLTRTCYKDQKVACGKCGACQERLEAWASLGKEDPIEYESREILSK